MTYTISNLRRTTFRLSIGLLLTLVPNLAPAEETETILDVKTRHLNLAIEE